VSVPASRLLPAVLREKLEREETSVLIGRVTGNPDRAHVTVNVGEGDVTIPKLASYGTPIVGEPAFVLIHPLFTIALGSVSASPPPGAGNADLLDGYDSSAFWRKAEPVNADQLDGLDSRDLVGVGTAPPGSRWRIGGFSHGLIGNGPGGTTTIAHPYGKVPEYFAFSAWHPSLVGIQTVEATSTHFVIRWLGINTTVAAIGVAVVFV
jgi:hypothetical protein